MYFRGGETVIPNHALTGANGYANGTAASGVTERQPIIIQIDGQTIFKAVKDITYYKNTQNNVRNAHGSVTGRMGTR